MDPAQAAQPQPLDATQLNEDIRQLVRQCQHLQDTLRPSSIVILEKYTGLFSDTFKNHLEISMFRLPADFWTHEISCRVCRRILKAGGVEYAERLDQMREEFTLDPIPTVKQLRAEGEATATAILCTRAVTALPGTIADGKEVASLVIAGTSFEASIFQIRQRKSNSAAQEHRREDEDEGEAED